MSEYKTALRKKSEESNIKFSILHDVYKRGLAAWEQSHRKGVSQHAWAMARVNSFIEGGKTRTTADADLWRKHKNIKEELSVSDGLGVWIRDFQDSKNPMFDGKSQEKRKQMAIAAYLNAKRGR